MSTKPIKSLFIIRVAVTLLLLVLTMTGVWAQAPTTVTTEEQLTGAIADDANIQLTADIQLSSYLYIAHSSVTIDLNGHKLSRSLSDYSIHGSVIEVDRVGTLILKSSAEGGTIEGGKATFGGGIKVFTGGSLSVDGVKFTNNCASDHGGAIFVQSGTNVSFNNTKFINNSANDHAGAIWNNGTLTATDCTFTGNTASDVGAIYNSVTVDGAGRALLTGCTFTENEGTAGAGALANALGTTEMTIENCTFTDNIASSHGGGIWNGGTLTVTNSTFTNNIANDVGGIYNATDGTTAGNATLRDCTFTRNRGIAGAGALANALGDTEMTIEDCTIENNSAYQYGAGIWNGGTLNMKGAVKVTGNKNDDNVVSNLYLKSGKVVTLTGAITGSNIGVDLETISGTFTSGYNTYHGGVDPSNFFSADRRSAVSLDLNDNGEVCLSVSLFINYIERSWDETNKEVVSTEKALRGALIGYDIPPTEGTYKEVTNAPASTPDEWFGMGGYSDNVAEFYVVRGNVHRKTIVVQGKDVHLVLCDGATLTLTGGLKLEGDNKLYIHSQSYGDDMGQLMVTNSYENAAGIGSAWDNGVAKSVGELVIYGGHIEATGGDYGAGIGSCSENDGSTQLCSTVTVYGGYVKAQGGKQAAGIGGGSNVNGGNFILYDGTVTAFGGDPRLIEILDPSNPVHDLGDITSGGAGVGGGGHEQSAFSQGEGGIGGNVTIYGGTLTATGGPGAAGIGSAHTYINQFTYQGGTFTIHGGTVTANGGKFGAGIGGGYDRDGAIVSVYGGTVTATGGYSAAGIGGGINGDGGKVTITGGKVTAKGGKSATAIGSGYKVISSTSGYGTLTFGDAMMVGAGDDGSVESFYNANERKNGCWFHSYAEVSPCTHPSGVTYTINEDSTHTSHCKHCSLAEKADHFNSDGTGTCVCGYKDGGVYYTITIATSSNGTTYEGVGITANVGNDKPYTLPECSTIPEGYDFAGWVVNPQSQDNGIQPNEDETLLAANSEYIVTASVSIFARYKALEISLADDSNNSETLYTYNGKKNASVTLEGRKLFKDGTWNTLCLPFSLTADQIAESPLAGADIRTLSSASFNDGTLTLTFTDEDAVTSITAGTPYIVKWAVTNPNYVENPVFNNVTISNANNPVETDVVDFVGTFSPYDIFTEEKTNLYLGADNKLYYPAGENLTSFTVNAFRAFFQLKNGLTAGEPTAPELGIKAFVLNIDDRETGIEEVQGSEFRVQASGWYSIDGRKLEGRPKSKGIYLFEGRKVLIK